MKKQNEQHLIPGSKIPIAYLLDYLKEGHTIDEFISSYPWIKRNKIKQALDEIKNREFTARYAF